MNQPTPESSISQFPDPAPIAGRVFRSAIPLAPLNTIQAGTLAHTYKGIPLLKNPFDLALYAQLVWNEKPATIIEIGSFKGGSALWFADQMVAFGLRPNVVSIDIDPVVGVTQTGVQYVAGDANNLAPLFTPDFVANLPRPWFVIEDSNHFPATCRAVLDFFHTQLKSGEYIAVEDGIVTDLEVAHFFDGGPNFAVASFLEAHPDAYEIDTRYCDHFGYNFTYNINGYLRRI